MLSRLHPNTSLEWEFLLTCVRTQLTESAFEFDDGSVAQLDWDRFLHLSQRHRVAPHVHAALSASPGLRIPDTVTEQLSKLQADVVEKNLQLTAELLKLLREFDSRDLPVIPFKGPVLAFDLYGGLHRRQFVDLDILVKPDSLLDALRALKKLGYRNTDSALDNLSGRRLVKFLRRFKSHTLIHSSRKFTVDLHWRLSEDAALYSVPFDELLSAGSSCEISGEVVRTMSPRRSLEYLAFHACKHGCMRLSWLCDVAWAARRIPDANWNSMLEEQRPEVARMIVAAMLMLESLSLTDPLMKRIDNIESWRRKLSHPLSIMQHALLAEKGRSVHGANVGLLRWKLSGNLKFFVDSILRMVMPKQYDLVEPGIIGPHLSRWNYLAGRGAKAFAARNTPTVKSDAE